MKVKRVGFRLRERSSAARMWFHATQKSSFRPCLAPDGRPCTVANNYQVVGHGQKPKRINRTCIGNWAEIAASEWEHGDGEGLLNGLFVAPTLLLFFLEMKLEFPITYSNVWLHRSCCGERWALCCINSTRQQWCNHATLGPYLSASLYCGICTYFLQYSSEINEVCVLI